MKILQFGEGNFLRGFFDWMLQKITDATGERFEVILVQPKWSPASDVVVEDIARQGTYHVLLRSFEDDQYHERVDAVSVISEGVDPFRDQERFLRLGLDPDIALITSNTTEAGIAHEPGQHDPHNFPSYLALLLNRRAEAGLPPVSLLPLELLDRNGDDLKACLLAYGRDFGYGKTYTDYLEQCRFYNTLVDRTVPGFPTEDKDRIWKAYGKDRYLTSGELFHLFVIEGDAAILKILPFDKAGLNVVVTPNRLAEFHDRKVRVLNGTHTASVPYALFSGLELVDRFVDSAEYGEWLRHLMHDEIVFAFGDREEDHRYADEVLQRFRNPTIGHNFRSIALNSIAKSNTRLRPTLEDYWKKTGSTPPRMTQAVKKMIELYSTPDGVRHDLPGGEFVLTDYPSLEGAATPAAILERLLPGLDPKLKEAILA